MPWFWSLAERGLIVAVVAAAGGGGVCLLILVYRSQQVAGVATADLVEEGGLVEDWTAVAAAGETVPVAAGHLLDNLEAPDSR